MPNVIALVVNTDKVSLFFALIFLAASVFFCLGACGFDAPTSGKALLWLVSAGKLGDFSEVAKALEPKVGPAPVGSSYETIYSSTQASQSATALV